MEQKKINNLMKNSYKFMQSQSTKPTCLTSRNFTTTYDGDKIWDTPYSVVGSDRSQQLVKEELAPTVAPFEHNGSISMARTMPRAPFIDERKGPNEQRFC